MPFESDAGPAGEPRCTPGVGASATGTVATETLTCDAVTVSRQYSNRSRTVFFAGNVSRGS